MYLNLKLANECYPIIKLKIKILVNLQNIQYYNNTLIIISNYYLI